MRNIIKYALIILAVIGIGLVIRNVVNNSKSTDEWKGDESNSDSYYQVTVSLLDKDSNDFIEGSVLTIKTEAGQVLEKWTTTKDAYIITLVPKGSYTLEQVSTIDGYVLNEDKIEFTVEDKDLKLVMYNESEESSDASSNTTNQDVPVVNTLSLKSPLVSVLGISIITFGIVLIVFYKKNIKNNG